MDNKYVTIASDKSKKTATILCCIGFLGIGGLHEFYVGRFGKGLIKLFTANWFVIGTIIDLIKLLNGTFADANGQPLKKD